MTIFVLSLAIFAAFVYEDSNPIVDLRQPDIECTEKAVALYAGKSTNLAEEAHIELVGKRNRIARCKDLIMAQGGKRLRPSHQEVLARSLKEDLPKFLSKLPPIDPNSNWHYTVHTENGPEKSKIAGAVEQFFAEKKQVVNPLRIRKSSVPTNNPKNSTQDSLCQLTQKLNLRKTLGVFFDPKNQNLSVYFCSQGETKWLI